MNHRDTEAQRKRLSGLSHQVIGFCFEIHRELGPGLLESAYEGALACELTQAALPFDRQREMPLIYKGAKLDCGYRLDFIVAGELVLALKAVGALLPVYHAQLLSYLKLEHRALGQLINFNESVLKDGVRRVVCGDLFKDRVLVC